MMNYASGLRWGFIFNLSTKLVALIAGLFLARTLGPEVMNAYWLALTVFVFADLFREFGLLTAYLNDKAVDEPREASYHRLAIATGLLTGVVVAMLGYPLSRFFGTPQLIEGCPYIGALLVLNGLTTIPLAKLFHMGRFKETGLIETLSFLMSYLVAIGLVLAGVGFPALMIQLLLCSAITMVMAIKASKVRWHAAPEGTYPGILKKGFSITSGNLLWLSYSSLDQPLVSKFFGPLIGGNYGIAKQLTAKPGDFLGVPLMRIVQVAIGHRAGTTEPLKVALTKAVIAFLLVMVPMFVCLSILAEPFVQALLGDKYPLAPAMVPPLCAYSFARLFGAVPGNVVIALGKASAITSSWILGFLATGIYAVFRWGKWDAVEIAWVFALGFILVNGLILAICIRKIGIRQGLGKRLVQSLLCTVLVGLVAYGIDAIDWSPWVTVGASILSLPVFYAGVLGIILAGNPFAFLSKARTREIWKTL